MVINKQLIRFAVFINFDIFLKGGLFFYDIFWVFGTDVMVTVAKSFEAPIKLVFPQVSSNWYKKIQSTEKSLYLLPILRFSPYLRGIYEKRGWI